MTIDGRTLRARADDGARAVPAVLATLDSHGVAVASVTVARPSLDDVYLRHAGRTFGEADQNRFKENMTALAHTRYMTATHLRQLWRQPWWIAVSLVQPVIWLLLFGALFQSVADLPGFGSDDYIVYLAPGIVIMTAFISAGWTGMGLLEDLDRGVTDRLLTSPISRRALMAGRVVQQTITMIIQSLIMVGIALLAGRASTTACWAWRA